MGTRTDASFANARFAANQDQVQWFAQRIVRALAAETPARILDIGCGDGSLLIHLADLVPGATLVGVDVSAANIASAGRAVEQRKLTSRITLMHADFLSCDAGRFDALVAYSSLQFMPASTAALAATLMRSLHPSGRIIHATPYACTFNTLLNSARQVLRRVRNPALDAILLAGGRALHPGAPAARVRQAIDYMYRPIVHYEDAIRSALVECGLHVVHTEPVRHGSLGQPKHRLAVMGSTR